MPQEVEVLRTRFVGTVLPAGDPVFAYARVGYGWPDIPWSGDVEITIAGGHVVADLYGVRCDDLATLRNHVSDLVGTVLDGAGYSLGRAFRARIDAAVTPDPDIVVFADLAPVAADNPGARPVEAHIVGGLAMRSPHLARALAELRRSILEPGETYLHCYRAVESIRQAFAEGVDRATSWEKMRSALRVERSPLDALDAPSRGLRHGEGLFQSAEDRRTAMALAWTVVDRFVLLLHLGVETLSKDEFPLVELPVGLASDPVPTGETDVFLAPEGPDD